MKGFILDSYALIAYFEDEPGAEKWELLKLIEKYTPGKNIFSEEIPQEKLIFLKVIKQGLEN